MRHWHCFALLAWTLLLAPSTFALTFDATTEALIHTMITGTAKLPNGVTSIDAFIDYYPRNGYNQTVTKHRVTSLPVAYLSGKDEVIRLTWNDPGPSVEFTISDHVRSSPQLVTYDRLDPWNAKKTPKNILPYLRSTPFIDADNERILATAKSITKGSQTQQEAAWRIGQWVRSTISYNLSTITKDVSQKASWVLDMRQGVCDEISVLFIAMLRATGIPARFVNGMVYTESNDLPRGWNSHAWAEVWFPSKGWVPFDITFAQFGWLDASHIRVADHTDIDESSIEYRWRGPEGVVFSPITITGDIAELTSLKRPSIDLSLFLTRAQVGPGSTVVVTARASNPTPRWTPLTISLTKAPGMIGDHLKPVFLPPYGRSSVSFLVTIPTELGEGTYSSTIEVSTSTGQQAITSVEFGDQYPITDALTAMEELSILEEESRQDRIPSLDTQCAPVRQQYNLLNTAEITCQHTNVGQYPLSGTTCLEETCQSFTLQPHDRKRLSFTTLATANHWIALTTKLNGERDQQQVSYAPIHVAFSPSFTVAKVSCPGFIGYADEGTLQFFLNATSPVQGVRVSIEGLGVMDIPDFAGEYNVTVPVRGKDVQNPHDSLVVYATAYREDGHRTEDFEQCPLHVTDIPWWKSINIKDLWT